MLAIKLQRIGKKHQPSFRVVVAERRSKLGGPPVEDLGSYNPFTKSFNVKADRVTYWIGVGAKPTATTHNLFVKGGVLKSPKIKIRLKQKEKAAEAPATAGATPAAPAAEVAA